MCRIVTYTTCKHIHIEIEKYALGGARLVAASGVIIDWQNARGLGFKEGDIPACCPRFVRYHHNVYIYIIYMYI